MTTYLDPLVGRECSRITIDAWSPIVVLWFLYGGPTGRVEIDAPFFLRAGERTETLAPEGEREALAPVMRLIGQSVVAAALGEEDALHLEFSGDLVLDVPGGSDETWWFDMVRDETALEPG